MGASYGRPREEHLSKADLQARWMDHSAAFGKYSGAAIRKFH